MAKPSWKSPEMTAFLDGLAGRTDAITNNKCVQKPFGCGGPAIEFRNDISKREYSISGLCQACQDDLFQHRTRDE